MSKLPLCATLAGLATALTATAPAGAQTLSEALAQAYYNNPTLQTARAQLRVVDENVPQALSGWRPSVTLSGNYGATDASQRSRTTIRGNQVGIYSDLDRSPAAASATLSQPIYRGGRTIAATARAENQVLGQRARLLATEQQIMNDSVTAYVAVIQNQDVVRLNRNNVQVLQRQLDATNERFRVGEITRTDVAQAESRLAGSRATLAQSEGQLQTARAQYERVIGSPPGRLVAPQPINPPVRSAVEAGRVASMNNPNVVAALFEEAAARNFIDVQTAALLPQASLQAQSFRSDNANFQGTRLTGESVTATLSVPLYQGGAEYSSVRAARQEAVRTRQVIDEQRRAAIQQATAAWETLQAVRAQVEAVRVQIRAQQIALDGVQREAIVGSRTTLDVLNAEQELLNANVSLVSALASVVNASHALVAALGRLTARDLRLPVELYNPEEYYNAVRNRWAGLGNYANQFPPAPNGATAAAVQPAR